MSLMILEVDGSLRNPSVAWAIALWTTSLVIIAVVAARRYRRNPRTRFTTVAALLALASPIFVKIIASLFYILPAGALVGVHFWGISRVQWLGPVVALVVFFIVLGWPRRQVAAV